jgi:hypothetical protein
MGIPQEAVLKGAERSYQNLIVFHTKTYVLVLRVDKRDPPLCPAFGYRCCDRADSVILPDLMVVGNLDGGT